MARLLGGVLYTGCRWKPQGGTERREEKKNPPLLYRKPNKKQEICCRMDYFLFENARAFCTNTDFSMMTPELLVFLQISPYFSQRWFP